jgi:GNAT superfamily N-acetyltransferase
MTELPRGYSYDNPASAEFGRFEVVPASPERPVPPSAAARYQDVIFYSLAEQLEGLRTPRQVATTANPADPSMVEAQACRLAEADGSVGAPSYLQAMLPNAVAPKGSDDPKYMAGFGKAKYADGRGRLARLLSLTQPPEERAVASANLADIGEVYIWPQFQGEGFGAAIVHSMLGGYSKDMVTAVSQYPSVNQRAVGLIQGMGFSALKVEHRRKMFCGEETPRVIYGGPAVGDLKQELEARYPWLRERQPIMPGA